MVAIDASLIGIDTNVFIYYFQRNRDFGAPAKVVFHALANKTKAVTSVITLVELLAFKAPNSDLEMLKNRFLATENLAIVDINQPIALEAARIQRTYGIRISDSLQLATSLVNRAEVFITNDSKLNNFKEIKIVLLNDLPI